MANRAPALVQAAQAAIENIENDRALRTVNRRLAVSWRPPSSSAAWSCSAGSSRSPRSARPTCARRAQASSRRSPGRWAPVVALERHRQQRGLLFGREAGNLQQARGNCDLTPFPP